MEPLNNSRKLFYEIVTVKLKASLLLNASLCICPLTFVTEAICLVARVLGVPSVVIVPHYLSLFGRHSQLAVLLRPCPSIVLTAPVM